MADFESTYYWYSTCPHCKFNGANALTGIVLTCGRCYKIIDAYFTPSITKEDKDKVDSYLAELNVIEKLKEKIKECQEKMYKGRE